MDSSDCKKVPEEGIVAREDVLYVIVGKVRNCYQKQTIS